MKFHTIHFSSLSLVSALALVLALVLSMDVSAKDEEGEGNIIPLHIGIISFEGGMTWYLQTTDGAPQNTTALSYSLDLGLQAQIGEYGKAVIALEAGDGRGVDATLHSLSTANYDAFYTNLTNASPDATNVVVASVSQAYYEGEYLEGGLVVSIGKLDVHAQYDDNAYANDETDQFMSGIFTRSAGTSYAELDQYYAPGIALKYSATKAIDLTIIAANGNGDGFDDISDYLYLVGQVNFKPRLAGRDGNYRLYAISDDRHGAYHEINSGNTASNSAWGLSFDQSIIDGVGLFARYSTQDDGIAENVIKSSWSLGALLEGTLWGRGKDTIGIGYGSVNLNEKVDPAAVLGFGNTGDESHIEAFYKVWLSDHITLTGDVQVINNNGGDASASTVTVAGIRGQLNF
jgi:Carbohydrate-selective porin, OprB family